MLYIRKINPSLNRQMNSELFSFVRRNAKKDSDITRDIQKYLKPKNTTNNTVFTCKKGNIRNSYIPALFRFSFNSDIILEEKL